MKLKNEERTKKTLKKIFERTNCFNMSKCQVRKIEMTLFPSEAPASKQFADVSSPAVEPALSWPQRETQRLRLESARNVLVEASSGNLLDRRASFITKKIVRVKNKICIRKQEPKINRAPPEAARIPSLSICASCFNDAIVARK